MNEIGNSDLLFSLENVSLDGESRPVLDSVNLHLQPRQLYLIAGPSGGGKTSLLRLLNGLVYPSSGTVRYLGKDVCDYNQPSYRSEVVSISQEPVMFPGTVSDNIAVAFSYASNASKKMDDVEVLQLMDGLGLSRELLKQDVNILSGGEKQRVALIRSLILSPEVLLADEPTSALDPHSEEKVFEMFGRLKGSLSLVVVSHSTRFLTLADEIVLIARGKIIVKRKTIDAQQFKDFLEDEDGGRNG